MFLRQPHKETQLVDYIIIAISITIMVLGPYVNYSNNYFWLS